jgi:hypothetical protein
MKLRSLCIAGVVLLGVAINWAGETIWSIFAEGDGPGPIIRVDSFYLEKYGTKENKYHIVVRDGPRAWRTSHHLDPFQVRAMSEYLGVVWERGTGFWGSTATYTPSTPGKFYRTWMDGDTIWDMQEVIPFSTQSKEP